MSLLVLDRVSKRYLRGRRGVRERVALRDVSLAVAPGEFVGVVGRRRSGRTTLLHVAAGVEPPSGGTIGFGGVDLAARSALGAHGGIAYVTTTFSNVVGDTVVEHVAAPLLGGDAGVVTAQGRAHEALRRVDAAACAELDAEELDPTETIRVAIARALVTDPRLLLVDDPILGVRLSDRDALLALLGSLARTDGIAVLMTVGEATCLAGVDRALSIDCGELRGETLPSGGTVVALRRRRTDVPA